MSRTALAYAPVPGNQLTEGQQRVHAADVKRAEALDVARSIAERADLPTGADIEVAHQTPGRLKPAQRTQPMDGLDFLKAKLTKDQYDTGRRFERFWLALHGDLQSGLNAMEVRGSNPGYSLSQTKAFARMRLAKAFNDIGEHAGMWQALTQVCGQGKKPSEITTVRRDYERIEANLDCALAILVKGWGG